MRDEQLDDLVGATDPISRPEMAALASLAPHADLCEGIMATPVIDTIDTADERPPRWRRRLRHRLAFAGAAVAAAVVGVAIQPFGSDGGGTAWAAETIAVAEAAPRLLVTADGWEIDQADEFTVDYGAMEFAGPADGEVLGLEWTREGMARRAGSDFEEEIRMLTEFGQRLPDITIDGRQVALFQDEDLFQVVWKEGDYVVHLGGWFADLDAFMDVVTTIQAVDVDTWLSAMPEEVVQPARHAEVVEQMLEGMPLPDGFDVSTLAGGGSVSDRYHLGARVSGAVACAWIGQWVDARATGDTAAAQAAIDAMATSHDWDVLQQMNEEGDYPEMVWELADAIAEGDTIGGGSVQPIADVYGESLGCPST